MEKFLCRINLCLFEGDTIHEILILDHSVQVMTITCLSLLHSLVSFLPLLPISFDKHGSPSPQKIEKVGISEMLGECTWSIK